MRPSLKNIVDVSGARMIVLRMGAPESLRYQRTPSRRLHPRQNLSKTMPACRRLPSSRDGLPISGIGANATIIGYRMAIESVRKVFWSLLLLEAICLLLNNNIQLRLLRITQFGESGDEAMLNTYSRILALGFAATYITAVVISIKGRTWLGTESLWSRLKILGMTVTWPLFVYYLYAFLIGYPAS